MPRVLAPSVNSTTMSGTYPPLPGGVDAGGAASSGLPEPEPDPAPASAPPVPPGPFAVPELATVPTGFTSGFTSAMASSPFNMAAPIAVPRPVDNPLMASTNALRSVVGGTTNSANPENT